VKWLLSLLLIAFEACAQGATIGADARVKRQAVEDVKAFLKHTLLR
jgi:hypothetical protein